jgi:signal transduction histidine kinase
LNQSVALSRLVDDLLLLARAEINELHLQLAPTSIVPLLESEVHKWQRMAEDRELKLKVEHGVADIQLELDGTRIRQVLSILLDNAIKYSAADSHIVVSTHRQTHNLVVSVEDRGRGISAAELDHIFERFVRFNKHEEGLGLGLPIAKAIIEAHGGEISAQSAKGQGSTFSLYLPC